MLVEKNTTTVSNGGRKEPTRVAQSGKPLAMAFPIEQFSQIEREDDCLYSTLLYRRAEQRSQCQSERCVPLQSTKAMTFPVLPPTLLSAFPRFCAAFAIAGPAVAVSLDKLCCALAAVSLALEAASEADEACRLTAGVLRKRKRCDGRSTARDDAGVTGILSDWAFSLRKRRKGVEGVGGMERRGRSSQWGLVFGGLGSFAQEHRNPEGAKSEM